VIISALKSTGDDRDNNNYNIMVEKISVNNVFHVMRVEIITQNQYFYCIFVELHIIILKRIALNNIS
jgi:hypothetical protein